MMRLISFNVSLLLLAGITLLLAGCAPVQRTVEDKAQGPLVYPPPPEDPRFVYEGSIRSSADITPVDEEMRLRAMLTGEARVAVGLGKPYAVAVHQGRIFVSDSTAPGIKVFDVPGRKFFIIGEEGQDSVQKAIGLDVDLNGTLYVADSYSKAIMIYDRDGNFLRKIAARKEDKLFDRLTSVSVDHQGKRLYVVDIGGVSSENHRVLVFDAQTGEHLHNIGKRGNGPGEFNLPRDAVVGKDGRLYVVDGGNFRVQIFDAEGNYLSSFGKVGKNMGDFARPKEIAADQDGNIYVADAAFGNFQVFNADGDLLMWVGERSENDNPGNYMLPSGITIDEDGRIYFVDQWFRRLDIFRPWGLQAEEGYLAARPDVKAKK